MSNSYHHIIKKISRFFFLGVSLLAIRATLSREITQKLPSNAGNANPFDTIVITGTKTEKLSVDAPVKTEVIGEKQINDMHLTSIDQVIQQVPGVRVQQNRGREGTSAVIQGLSSSKVMVLMDGIPIIQDSNSGVDLTKISTENVKQVEVVKGAASSRYGSQAMGGVINIITKPSQKRAKYHLNIQSGIGNSANLTGQTKLPEVVSGSVSAVSFGVDQQVDFSRRTREAIELDPNSIVQDGAKFTKDNGSIQLKKRWKNNNSVALRYRYGRNKINSNDSIPVRTGGFNAVETKSDIRDQAWTLIADKKFGQDKLATNLTYYRVDDQHILYDNPLTPYPEQQKNSLYQQYRGEIQFDKVLFSNHIITSGLVTNILSLNQTARDYRSEDNFTERAEIEKKYYRSFEAYLQDDILLDHWEFVFGGRGQYDKDFGLHIAPKVSTIYSPDLLAQTKTQIRASISNGYRVPNLKEKYYLLDHSSFGYQITGNQALAPESSTSVQIGPEVLSKKYGNLSINFFYNNVKNLITYQEGNSSGPLRQFTYLNTSRSETRGYELDYRYHFNAQSFISQKYTYSEAINKSTNLYIPGRPLYSLQTIVGVGLGKYTNWVNSFNYEGNEYIDEENTLVARGHPSYDTRLNYQSNKNLTLHFGINNIFDQKRDALADQIPTEENTIQTFDKRPLIGRYIYLGLTIKN